MVTQSRSVPYSSANRAVDGGTLAQGPQRRMVMQGHDAMPVTHATSPTGRIVRDDAQELRRRRKNILAELPRHHILDHEIPFGEQLPPSLASRLLNTRRHGRSPNLTVDLGTARLRVTAITPNANCSRKPRFG